MVKTMEITFCRDCANFEDRRDIDNATLCKKKQGPYVCCEDFEPVDESIDEDRLYYRFCLECKNFYDVNGIPVCGKNHTPGVACQEFVDRFEKLTVTRQNSHMKTALLTHAIKSYSNPLPVPESLIEIGRKIKW